MDIESNIMPTPVIMSNTMVMNNTVYNTVYNTEIISKSTPNKKKKQTYNSIMVELLKPPPKEEKPNVHLSGGGQFSKLNKI